MGRFLCYHIDQRSRMNGETRADGVDTSVDVCPGRVLFCFSILSYFPRLGKTNKMCRSKETWRRLERGEIPFRYSGIRLLQISIVQRSQSWPTRRAPRAKSRFLCSMLQRERLRQLYWSNKRKDTFAVVVVVTSAAAATSEMFYSCVYRHASVS